MSAKGIIGPFWFENDEGETETVNTERYMEVVRQFLAELREDGVYTYKPRGFSRTELPRTLQISQWIS